MAKKPRTYPTASPSDQRMMAIRNANSSLYHHETVLKGLEEEISDARAEGAAKTWFGHTLERAEQLASEARAEVERYQQIVAALEAEQSPTATEG